MRKSLLTVLTVAASVIAVPQIGHAALINGNYSFSASNFTTSSPFSSVTGIVTISFDNTQNYMSSSAGITETSGTITPSSPLTFTYLSAPDILVIGGLANTVTNSDPASTDFALFIGNASTSPTVTSFTYSVGTGAVYVAATDSVSFSPASSVPEPASLTLLGMGLLGAIRLHRRK